MQGPKYNGLGYRAAKLDVYGLSRSSSCSLAMLPRSALAPNIPPNWGSQSC